MNLSESQAEPLAAAGRKLAAHHEISDRKPRTIACLAHIGRITEWLGLLRAAAKEPEPGAAKAAEWLLDNDFQVRRAARQAAMDLPPDFYAQLPSLAEIGNRGPPRILAVARGLLRASHLQLSLSGAVEFIRGYQEVTPLTIGELWAFPTLLRLVCLEILTDACAHLFPDVPPPFTPMHVADAIDGFDDSERVARTISSLIAITAIRWKDFFDRASLVEAILRTDPAGVYARMDFETRDRYRKVVEGLAREADRTEWDIAEEAVARAKVAADAPADHVGYWLIGDGRRDFEELIGCRIPWLKSSKRRFMRRPGLLYASMLALACAIALILPAAYLDFVGAGIGGWILGIGLASVPASVLGVTFVHWIITLVAAPMVLAKLDFENGLPPDCVAAVAVPVILGKSAEVPRLMRHLESHRLANPESSLRYVLLSDLPDAPEEHMPADGEIERALVDGIRRLNDLHGKNGIGPFFLLHRSRKFNPCEACWMGWERKRGKLENFNKLVLDGDASRFALVEGDPQALETIRFVVTVDADTVLPPGAVARLVGTLAHPLNSARFDDSGRVRAGYTIVQPRVEISPLSGGRSLFARLFAGNTAIDIYTRAVSDVYQDLFGEGIYVGKGVYEVATFQRSLAGRVPENALVSHDLFEGVHGRAALASDIVLYENFPGTYVEYTRRWHRWIRGDWQLLPWLLAEVPGSERNRFSNELSALDRWKILDNLRRSLIPLSLLLLVTAGWLVLPGNPWVWTALAVAAPGAYLFTDIVTGLARGPRRGAMQGIIHRVADHWGRWALAIVFLVHDSLIALDAVTRTLWRLSISRQHLLEWTSAAHTAATIDESNRRKVTWRHMWPAPVLAVGLGLAVSVLNPTALAGALPLLVLWFLSPEIAIFIGRPKEPPTEWVNPEDEAFLRRLARRTWLYFEVFLGPADNWLPPDNFQEEPHAVIAHRTSPTNIGMMFLSTLAAWDLGYVDTRELSVRISDAFDTLDRLERYRGHLLNWYGTTRLEPLEPRYISTVDSGNLAVCLIALKQGCQEASCAPAMSVQLWDGLVDALGLLSHSAVKLPGPDCRAIEKSVSRFTQQINHARADPAVSWFVLVGMVEKVFPELQSAVVDTISSAPQVSAEALHDVQIWLERVQHHLSRMRDDFAALSPWQPLVDAPPSGQEGLAARIGELLSPSMTLDEASGKCSQARQVLAADRDADADVSVAKWIAELDASIEEGGNSQDGLHKELLALGLRAEQMALGMDFRPLYDTESKLFHIGYNVSSDRIDPSHYDLLASEARLASFFAIAKGDVSFEHWFFLGRSITRVAGGLSLLSWNGSMFEYLMPSLLLRSAPGTLLGQSERSAVEAQRKYADRHGVPWGISESAFASQDADHNYRYRSFGVPDLGLRRDLAGDLVISPYATALALSVRTEVSVRNLRVLEDMGLVGTYGFFDAADFTPERVPPGKRFAIVKNFMAHHQGMTLAALDNALRAGILASRFGAHPSVHAMELLVQERIPWEIPSEVRALERPKGEAQPGQTVPAPHPWTPPANAPFPQLHALGNGRLSSWISEAGAGTLQWRGNALTRWLPDPTCDNWGMWIYVRDEDDGTLWSIGRQPTGVASGDSQVIFHPHMAEFHRRDFGIGIRMEVAVAYHDDVEIRRISLVNEGEQVRNLRLTSCGQVVLAAPTDDERHYAFSKLFVGSEYLPDQGALLFTRRPRQPDEKPPVMLHRLVTDDAGIEIAGFETDRARFLGRNGDMRHPRAMLDGLSGTTGWTLDTIMALDIRVQLAPEERRQLAFVTIAGESREAVLGLAQHFTTPAALDWALDDAAIETAREAKRIRLQPAVLPELQQLASLLVYHHSALRGPSATIAANRLGQQRLWAFGVSGDHPVLLVRATDPENTELLRVLIAGHQWWRKRGINIDLLVMRSGMSGYVEPLREQLISLLQEAGAQETLGRHGGIHLVLGDQIGEEERLFLEACADVVLDTAGGTLAEQLAAAFETRPQLPVFEPATPVGPKPLTQPIPRASNLQFDNGLGGFTDDGREYAIYLEDGAATPAPWCNVLANDGFGTIVTESGGGFTWAVNSGENRLTPWTNDPVADPPGESLYLRDEATAEVWTPTPEPAGAGSACEIRYGAGYSIWHRRSHQLEQKLTIFVPADDPVKIVQLELRNLGAATRRISATYYAEWLLGALRSVSKSHVVCGYDPSCHALTARNSWNPDFADRVAFLTSDQPPHSLTNDRRDFLGREGNASYPDGLTRWDLGGRVGPGFDSCAAFQVHLDIAPHATVQLAFILGQGRDQAHAIELATQWQQPGSIDRALSELKGKWDQWLGAVHVRTPEPAFDLMLNRWLPYQTLSSRIMARAGFYQAGGAIGFRDQLQDVLALLFSDPRRARAHILAAAAHQFEEGDVLHWWHPPYDRGVRTRCSDDLLWLPYVTCCYVEATGDDALLDETVPFLSATPLKPTEHDRYARYDSVSAPHTLMEHCERALEKGVTSGSHGLPLMGSGDWNDGMDRVGRQGRGESVWLGWFAVDTMRRFADLSRRKKMRAPAKRWRARARQLEKAIEAKAWDGNWYLRAIDDHGNALGSAGAEECRIDSIAQSWSVLAGDVDARRARKAVESADRELVSGEARLARLLWPPFDKSLLDPGYIKAYPPGIRENGGQYSHAAAWLGHAFARLGDGDSAMRLFNCLNPIMHASADSILERYLVEPYALAADIGGAEPHTGRGGWTWYTGAAGWTWRLGVEAILGLKLGDGRLTIDPCLPKGWDSFQATVRGPSGDLEIHVENPERISKGQVELTIDGKSCKNEPIAFPTDGSVRRIDARLLPEAPN
jgi:cyclic beta-1,2-glucan glucanotransferase